MANTIFQQPLLAVPVAVDVIPIGHQADGKGYSVTLEAVANVVQAVGTAVSVTTSFGSLIYNYGNYVFQQLPATGASANTTALTTMLSAMASASPVGGEAWIPQVNYTVNFVSNGYQVPNQSSWRALGTGGSGQASAPSSYHFTLSGDGTFLNCPPGPHTSGGSYFWGLAVKAQNVTLASTTCIDANQWNARAMKCNFVNWPCAYNAGGVPSGTGSGAGLSAGLEQCTIQYLNGPNGQLSSISPVHGNLVPPTPLNDTSGGNPTALCPAQVVLSSTQAYAIGPGEFFQTPAGSGGGPTYVVGIGIGGTGGGAVEHAVIRDLHVSDFCWGISYCFQQSASNGSGASGSKGSNVSFVECQSWASCVFMMNPGVNSMIFGEKYTSCLFQKSHNSTDGSAIIYVDATTNGSTTASITDISFIDCTVFGDANTPQNGQYGYQLQSGSDFRIIGGEIANMGTGTGSANIAITGAYARVIIAGARIAPTYANANNPTNTSVYGILVSGNITQQVTIANCNMTGAYGSYALAITGNLGSGTLFTVDNCAMNSATAVQVTGTIASGTLFIRNCAGYNDQNTVVNTNANIGTSAQAAYNQGANSGTSYFGPSFVLYTANAGGATLKINGNTAQTVPASSVGTIWLNSPYDTFQWSAAPAATLWLGK